MRFATIVAKNDMNMETLIHPDKVKILKKLNNHIKNSNKKNENKEKFFWMT
ncbi:MAG: hypothetical protein GY938_32890 [Ketobacter sp.]|nr:hypothetical protein [Ketobacter sp.]